MNRSHNFEELCPEGLICIEVKPDPEMDCPPGYECHQETGGVVVMAWVVLILLGAIALFVLNLFLEQIPAIIKWYKEAFGDIWKAIKG